MTAPVVKQPWMKAAVDLLSDGKWHTPVEIHHVMMDLIPERYALDRFEPKFTTSVNAVNTTQRITQAKRYVALHNFRNLRRTGKIEEGPKGFRALW